MNYDITRCMTRSNSYNHQLLTANKKNTYTPNHYISKNKVCFFRGKIFSGCIIHKSTEIEYRISYKHGMLHGPSYIYENNKPISVFMYKKNRLQHVKHKAFIVAHSIVGHSIVNY